MRHRGWGLVVLACTATLAGGCDQRADVATVTVTETVEAQQPAERRQIVDDQTCEGIVAMRDTNERLARDGYADDYTPQYDQQLRAMGCIP